MLKKVRLLCLLAVIVCLGAAVACGAIRYNVDFYVDGELYATVGTDGERIAMPQDPEKDGQIFLGWYLSEDGEGVADDQDVAGTASDGERASESIIAAEN